MPTLGSRRVVASWIVPPLLAALLTSSAAASRGGSLNVSVTRVGSDSPVPAARLLAEETRTRTTHRSSPAGSDGRVALDRLPPGRYALAVELDGGVYPALTPVLVRDDRTEALQIQLAEEPKPQVSGTFARLWGNPITATLMILGAAIVLGVAIDAASDSPTPRVSPASP